MSKKNSKIRPQKKPSEAESRAITLAKLIGEKKGENIVIFDLRNSSPITDYFIIANGLSNIHLRTIADYLMEYEKPYHVEGLKATSWVLVDFIDVIVHLFFEEAREFYGLERLWGDAPIVKLQNDTSKT